MPLAGNLAAKSPQPNPLGRHAHLRDWRAPAQRRGHRTVSRSLTTVSTRPVIRWRCWGGTALRSWMAPTSSRTSTALGQGFSVADDGPDRFAREGCGRSRPHRPCPGSRRHGVRRAEPDSRRRVPTAMFQTQEKGTDHQGLVQTPTRIGRVGLRPRFARSKAGYQRDHLEQEEKGLPSAYGRTSALGRFPHW